MKHKFIIFAIIIIIFSGYSVFQFYFFKTEIRKNTRKLSGYFQTENTKLAIEWESIRQQLSLLELNMHIIETMAEKAVAGTSIKKIVSNNPVVYPIPRQPEKTATGQNTTLPVTVIQLHPEEPKPNPLPAKSGPARDDVQISSAYAAGVVAFEKDEYTRARLTFSQLL